MNTNIPFPFLLLKARKKAKPVDGQMDLFGVPAPEQAITLKPKSSPSGKRKRSPKGGGYFTNPTTGETKFFPGGKYIPREFSELGESLVEQPSFLGGLGFLDDPVTLLPEEVITLPPAEQSLTLPIESDSIESVKQNANMKQRENVLMKLPKTAQKLLDRARKSPHKTFSVTTAIRGRREDGIREKQAAEILVKEGLAKLTRMERSTDTLRDGTYRKVSFYTRTYQLL